MDSIILVLSLLFPQYQIKVDEGRILLFGKKEMKALNEEGFDELQYIVNSIFCLNSLVNSSEEKEYNPANKRAEVIAQKIMKGRQKLAKQKELEEKENKFNFIEQRISCVAAGFNLSLNEVKNYTFFQLIDSFNRLLKKEAYDSYISAKLAGAEGLEDNIQYWME